MSQRGIASLIIVLTSVAILTFGGILYYYMENGECRRSSGQSRQLPFLRGLPPTEPTAPASSSSSTQREAHIKTSTISPKKSLESGLAEYTDLPLNSVPSTPISVKFLVEHRTALEGKAVTVRGFVISTLLGEDACPPGVGACAQPRIWLVDTMSENRNKDYDLMVFVSEAENGYGVGQVAAVTGIVSSSKLSVHLKKSY